MRMAATIVTGLILAVASTASADMILVNSTTRNGSFENGNLGGGWSTFPDQNLGTFTAETATPPGPTDGTFYAKGTNTGANAQYGIKRLQIRIDQQDLTVDSNNGTIFQLQFDTHRAVTTGVNAFPRVTVNLAFFNQGGWVGTTGPATFNRAIDGLDTEANWVHFSGSVDLADSTNSDLASGTWDRVDLRLILFQDGVTDSNASYEGYFDNVVLTQAVPEPASIALIGLGGLVLLLPRRQRHATNPLVPLT